MHVVGDKPGSHEVGEFIDAVKEQLAKMFPDYP
jgi:hypothetical protein